MLYREWLPEWLENYVQSSVKTRTYIRYKEIAEQHIIPRLGELEMSLITPYVLQCYVTDLMKNGNLRTKQGLSANSVNAIITVVQNSLRTACSLGFVDEYAGDKIKRPQIRERRVECFSVSEQKNIEQYILGDGHMKYFGVLLCLYTGLRVGELLALEWTDLDMHKRELEICKTCYYGKDENGIFSRVVDVPKTESSIRTIPIPKQLMPYLQDLKKISRSSYVISNGAKPVSIRSYQRSFSLMLKRLGIKHRGTHALRHTFATRALECGMDVKTLSEILGHKSPTVTLNRYVHSLAEHKKDMMNRLGRLL